MVHKSFGSRFLLFLVKVYLQIFPFELCSYVVSYLKDDQLIKGI
jgi:hypothetical protein